MKVSLILPSFCRSKLLNLGLFSLSQQIINHDLEILVINDGIKDNTEHWCEQYWNKLNIRYIFTGHRNIEGIKFRSPSIALNIGIKQASGDIIILSCPEVFHLNNTIDNIIEPLLNNTKIISSHGKTYFDNTSELTNSLLKKPVYNLTGALLDLQLEHDTHRCEYSKKLPFCMGMYKKELINIGGYDEDFTGWGADDDDLVNRLQLNGLKYAYTNARIIHLYHGKQYDRGNFDNKEYQHNLKLFKERKDIIVRNKDRVWGIL